MGERRRGVCARTNFNVLQRENKHESKINPVEMRQTKRLGGLMRVRPEKRLLQKLAANLIKAELNVPVTEKLV